MVPGILLAIGDRNQTDPLGLMTDPSREHRTYCPIPVMALSNNLTPLPQHDDVIKWKHFPRYWPFVREIHRSPVKSSHKGQWRGVLMFSLIYTWINGWVNNREAGDWRRHSGHYDVIVMLGATIVKGFKYMNIPPNRYPTPMFMSIAKDYAYFTNCDWISGHIPNTYITKSFRKWVLN